MAWFNHHTQQKTNPLCKDHVVESNDTMQKGIHPVRPRNFPVPTRVYASQIPDLKKKM
jgi:hypothetical protein